MPQINILPIENTQVAEVKDVIGSERSRNNDDFGRYMAQQDNGNRSYSDNRTRSNSAGNSGKPENAANKSPALSGRDDRHNENREEAISEDVESSVYENDKKLKDARVPSESKHKITTDSNDSDENVDAGENLEQNNHDSKVSPDILLTVLGASEKALIDGESKKVDSESGSAVINANQTQGKLVGIDARLKELVANIKQPDNSTNTEYVSPLAVLRREQSLAEGEQAANTKAIDSSEEAKRLSNQSKLTALQGESANSNESSDQKTTKQSEALVGEQVSKLAKGQVSESHVAEDALKGQQSKLITLASDTAKLSEGEIAKNDQLKQQTLEKNPDSVKSAAISIASIAGEQEAQAREASEIDNTVEVGDHASVLKPKKALADSDVKNTTASNGNKQQPQVVNSNTGGQTSSATVAALGVEKPIENSIQVAQAPVEKVGQSTNAVQNHSRFVNQSTQDVVQTGEQGSQESSQQQEQSDQSSANEFIQKEIRLNNKSSEGVNAIEKGQSEANRAIDKSSVNQGQNANAHSSNDAAAIEKVMDRLSSEQPQASSTRNSAQVASEVVNVNRKDFAENVKDKVVVMINKRLQQLEIRLDPAELGTMQVKLNMQNEQAAVSIVVQNSQAKEAIDQNIQKLRDMLQESGVDVGDANIEHREASEQQEFSEIGNQNRQSDIAEGGSEEIALKTQNLYKASSTGVDYYA